MSRIPAFPTLSRRQMLALGGALALAPRTALAQTPQTIAWRDLIPEDVAYPEVVEDGEIDVEADTWKPVWDENASRLNTSLEGKLIRMPGFIIPMETSGSGITEFILAPFVGACIHVPPPPPNQLVMVTTNEPLEGTGFWTAVWVTGRLEISHSSTEIAEIGYRITALDIEIYDL
ncbi:DUF3299 domain-containing protein [Pseudoroseicyclus sp. H15]